MSNQLVRRQARFTFGERVAGTVPDELLALVNRYRPQGEPELTQDSVYIRSAMVCNDMVDHYSTRFTAGALRQIVMLIPGVNLMRNHNEYQSDDLPVGRFIAGELVNVDGQEYVKGWFYYLKGDEFGDKMERHIASGIWREVSISWWMESYTCDVDGKPVSESSYWPGQVLTDGRVVIGIMDQVVEVNEVSLVSRGGQKNTSIGPARDKGVPDALELVLAARSRIEHAPPPPPSGEAARWWKGVSLN